jgi:hypothetical protein
MQFRLNQNYFWSMAACCFLHISPLGSRTQTEGFRSWSFQIRCTLLWVTVTAVATGKLETAVAPPQVGYCHGQPLVVFSYLWIERNVKKGNLYFCRNM